MTSPVIPGRVLAHPLHGRLYMLLQRLRGRPLRRTIEQLQAWESLDPDEFERLHARLLAGALENAKKNAALYQTGSWTGLGVGEPSSRQSPGTTGARDVIAPSNELASWPILEREQIEARPEALNAVEPGRPVSTQQTSGSSGTVLEISLTREDETWRWAQRYRTLMWHGIPMGSKTLRVSGVARPLRDLVLNQHTVPKSLPPEALEEAAEYLVHERPTLVFGPPSALFALARYLRESAVSARTPLAGFARVGGEPLLSFQRTEIERWIGRAVDSYGCNEVGPIAAECPAGSMHVLAENVHLEIVAGSGPVPPGEIGDIVLTSLRNTAMPLVRYRVGDRGRLSLEPCACGLPHPVLADLRARGAKTLIARDGQQRHVSELTERLGSFFEDPVSAGCVQIRLQQEEESRVFRVWLEIPRGATRRKAKAAPEPLETRLGEIIRGVCGADYRVELRIVESIPQKDGKYVYVERSSNGSARRSSVGESA